MNPIAIRIFDNPPEAHSLGNRLDADDITQAILVLDAIKSIRTQV